MGAGRLEKKERERERERAFLTRHSYRNRAITAQLMRTDAVSPPSLSFHHKRYTLPLKVSMPQSSNERTMRQRTRKRDKRNERERDCIRKRPKPSDIRGEGERLKEDRSFGAHAPVDRQDVAGDEGGAV